MFSQRYYLPFSPAFHQVPFESALSIAAPSVTVAVVPTTVTERKKTKWSETEEKILIEVYRENERRLKYRAYSSPEWQELVKELRKRCLKQQVSCDQARKQCKGKLANLTKKYKTMNDNLRCDL